MKSVTSFAVSVAMSFACMFGASTAKAATVVDTGGALAATDYSLNSNLAGSSYQHLAGQFTLAQATEITSVELWSRTTTAGSVAFGIAADGGTIPGTELFSSIVAVAQNFGNPIWVGTSGTSWVLGPGTYWATFIAQPGYFGAARSNAPSPLAAYAFLGPATGTWTAQQLDFGVRINGNAVSVVPVPASLPLLFGSLGGLVLLRRRRTT